MSCRERKTLSGPSRLTLHHRRGPEKYPVHNKLCDRIWPASLFLSRFEYAKIEVGQRQGKKESEILFF